MSHGQSHRQTWVSDNHTLNIEFLTWLLWSHLPYHMIWQYGIWKNPLFGICKLNCQLFFIKYIFTDEWFLFQQCSKFCFLILGPINYQIWNEYRADIAIERICYIFDISTFLSDMLFSLYVICATYVNLGPWFAYPPYNCCGALMKIMSYSQMGICTVGRWVKNYCF